MLLSVADRVGRGVGMGVGGGRGGEGGGQRVHGMKEVESLKRSVENEREGDWGMGDEDDEEDWISANERRQPITITGKVGREFVCSPLSSSSSSLS